MIERILITVRDNIKTHLNFLLNNSDDISDYQKGYNSAIFDAIAIVNKAIEYEYIYIENFKCRFNNNEEQNQCQQ